MQTQQGDAQRRAEIDSRTREAELNSALAASARDVMAANPSRLGWQRVEARSCGGQHPKHQGQRSGLIYWRRRREAFDEGFNLINPDSDLPLYAVEQVGTGLCVTDHWIWMQRNVHANEMVRRELGQPFTISPGPLAPGTTVTLTAQNGRWVWVVNGERAQCCGGYTATWPD